MRQGSGQAPGSGKIPPDSSLPPADGTAGPVRARYITGEITNLADEAIRAANSSLYEIAAVPPEQRTISNTLIRFEKTMGDFAHSTAPLTLMAYVYPDRTIADEGSLAEEKAGTFNVEVFTRRDLYDALRGQVPETPEELRLYTNTIRQFERNGLALPDDTVSLVRDWKSNLTRMETRFSSNLNNDNSSLEYRADELEGVPGEALATIAMTKNRTYLVTTKYPDYFAVMKNANRSETRKRMLYAFVNRQAGENTKLLEDAIMVRQQIAHELGYRTWADYKTDGRMAKSQENVTGFLAELKEPLKNRIRTELAGLLEIKRTIEPGATDIRPWDILYLQEVQRRQQYALDDEIIRQYFPLDVVTTGMFNQYSGLFGVDFVEVKEAKVWAEGVRLYRVVNQSNGKTQAYIYLDLFPREGKYGHLMTSGLIGGKKENGSYSIPVTAIVGNFRAPNNGIPSLLSHDDVVGLFHEFGHTLHNSLTTAPYASLSGYNVEWDFIETPSQAFENWAWEPEVLDSLSGHYTDHSKKIPPELRTRLIRSREIDTGVIYGRQLMIATEDMEFHSTEGQVDVTGISERLYQDIMGIPPIEGGHEPATIGHFMGGYDAGYYSYLWSNVYALNIYERFRKDGLSNQKTGRDYKHWILEQGNMQDGSVLLRGFLGHEPGMEPFYKRLGITSGINTSNPADYEK